MPIDDYLGKIEGIRTLKKLFIPPLESGVHISSLTEIYLESKQYKNYSYPDLLVSPHYLKAQNWQEAHIMADEFDSFVLTPRQFIDYLKLLKSGEAYNQSKKKINPKYLLNEFEKIINTDKLIWLDAEFKLINGIKHIFYNHKPTSQGPIYDNSDILDTSDYLKGYWSLSVDDILSTKNSYGLPDHKSDPGNNSIIKYHPPMVHDCVATYGGSEIREKRYNFESDKSVFRPGIVGDPLTYPVIITARNA